ncbi:prepilin peptidase [Kitasatospora sp. NPDC001540]|uniref:prepilin peptidase n=1 Tax=Kitasatospora sp. NPDC001540 TaxID=3364014 RepID=UPI0036795997
MPQFPVLHVLASVAALVLGALVLRPAAFAYTRPEDRPVPDPTCPYCGTQVLGRGSAPGAYRALVLRRRCVACAATRPGGGRIGPPALVPETLAAVGTTAVLAAGADGAVLAAQLWLVALGTVLICADFAVHRLPDHLTGAAALGVAALLTTEAAGSGRWGHLAVAAAAALGLGAVYFAMALLGQGLGDAKLVPSLAALVTWQYWFGWFHGVLLASVLAVMQWLVMRAAGTATRTTEIALGPSLIVGFLIVSAVLG